MKALKILLRVSLLFLLIALGFTAVFPEWFDLKDMLITDYFEQQNIKKRELKQKEVARVCARLPIVHSVKNKEKNLEIANKEKQKTDGTPKILINRNPAVFNNNICAGDTLEFNLFAVNIDRVMLSYDNNTEKETSRIQMLNKLNFKTLLTFTTPESWKGKSTITATGFKNKGKIRLASSKVTFQIKPKYIPENLQVQNHSAITEKASSPLSFQLKWRLDGKLETHTRLSLVDEKTLHIANRSKKTDSWRMKISLKSHTFKPNSVIYLTNDIASIFVKKLSPIKKYEPANIKNIRGTLTTGALKNGGYTVKFDVVASDNEIPVSNAAQHLINSYLLKGEALISRAALK